MKEIPYKLVIKFPTRGREKKFFACLDKYYELMEDKDNFEFVITCDIDDKEMNNEKVKEKFSKYNNLRVFYGNSRTKVQAINADLDKAKDFDIIIFASDDMIPVQKGYDNVIRQRMKETYPDLDGCLWFNDGYTNARINTLCILGKTYFYRYGFIYNPQYKSLWCDNEYTDIAQQENKIKYFEQVIIKHEHPCNTSTMAMNYDTTYRKNDAVGELDKSLYLFRKDKKFFSSIVWSILICSIKDREKVLEQLVNKLKKQIHENGVSLNVEILINIDNREKCIGQKRNELIDACNGKYLCFIDDDDEVSDDYIKILWEGIQKNPDVISLNGIITTDGTNPLPFIHSIKYKECFDKDGVYYRPPNHLNVVKRGYAQLAKFTYKNFGEDTDYCMRLVNLGYLKDEYNIDKPYYFYKFLTRK